MNNEDLKPMGSRLRMLRRERGMTLRTLAAKLNVTYSIIGNWETGRIQPGRNRITQLARFFGVNTAWLKDGVGPQTPDTLGPTPWPMRKIQKQWGVEAAIPDWPTPLIEFAASAVEFGLNPTTDNLLRVITRARELGTYALLPPELQVAVDTIRYPERSYRWPDFANWFLQATDSDLDLVEEIFSRNK